MPVWLLFIVYVTAVIGACIGVRYGFGGSFNVLHVTISTFFAVNIAVCLWELCLFRHVDRMKARADFWREQAKVKGSSVVLTFMSTRCSLAPKQLFSSSFWSDVYAAYSTYDPAYADKRSCGYTIDVANGCWTLLPTLLLLGNFTSPFMPALVAGVIGIALFYQWIYVTGMYVASFFFGGYHKSSEPAVIWIYIWGINIAWIIAAAIGFAISVRLLIDQHYGVLGLAGFG